MPNDALIGYSGLGMISNSSSILGQILFGKYCHTEGLKILKKQEYKQKSLRLDLGYA